MSRRGAHESAGSSQSELRALFSCIEYAVTLQAAARPSGATATSATRSRRQSVSMSRGRANRAVNP